VTPTGRETRTPIAHVEHELPALLVLLGVLIGAGGAPSPALAQGAGASLAEYALDPGSGERWELPGRLREVSGLALSSDGRLFAHGDERARIFERDPMSGKVLKEFHVGRQGIRGDFEGLAIAGDRFFLVDSDGNLIEFREGGTDERVDFTRIRSGVGRRCEVEGLAFDERTESLLLVCKTVAGRQFEDRLIVLAFSLESLQFEEAPRYAVPLRDLDAVGLEEDLNPSGIEVHPVTGTIYVLAARQHALVELSRDGRILAATVLSSRRHPQAEGLTFGADLSLYVADEGVDGDARLTRYRTGRPGPESVAPVKRGGLTERGRLKRSRR